MGAEVTNIFIDLKSHGLLDMDIIIRWNTIWVILKWLYSYIFIIPGVTLDSANVALLKKKHPNIDNLSHYQLKNTLQILQKFNITQLEACQNPHIFIMNPITMDNYGEILKECGFIKILPLHLIRLFKFYHLWSSYFFLYVATSGWSNNTSLALYQSLV